MPLSGTASSCSLTALTAAPAAGAAGERVVEIGPPRSSRTGYSAGEPADRAGQIGAGHDLLLAAVSLEVDQHRAIRRSRRGLAASAATARARAASRPSLTPPWNGCGIVVSSACVTCVENVMLSAVGPGDHVACRDRTGGDPISGSVPASIPRQKSSSATRCGDVASSTRPCAHRRIDVPTGSSCAGCPAVICDPAVARSGNSIRQDTPSTTRWCASTSRRPLAPATTPRDRTRRTASSGPSPDPAGPPHASSAARARAARTPSVARLVGELDPVDQVVRIDRASAGSVSNAPVVPGPGQPGAEDVVVVEHRIAPWPPADPA